MKIIVRDDDTSFFTAPEMLETVYASLWEKGHPVSLSVIPFISTSEVKHNFIKKILNSDFDLNAPPAFRGTNREFPVGDNEALCNFLKEYLSKGLVEILLHGFNHTGEYLEEDTQSIETHLNKGIKTLENLFPDIRVKTVVPPYEMLSAKARDFIIGKGLNISTDFESFNIKGRIDRIKQWRYMLRKKLTSKIMPRTTASFKGQRAFFGVNLFLPQKDAKECFDYAVKVFDECRREEKPLICVNHYWYFFDDWKGEKSDLLDAWHNFIDYADSFTDTEWVTFNGF